MEAAGKSVAGPREQEGPAIGKQQSRDLSLVPFWASLSLSLFL